MRRREGFTLIELLVVISIIALLVSVLMPSLTKAKKSAQAAVCLSNLHEFGIACKMYTQDYKCLMPPPECDDDCYYDWPPRLKPYYLDKKLLVCPSAKKTSVPPPEECYGGKFLAWAVNEYKSAPDEYYKGSYGINLFVSQNDSGGRAGRLWGNLCIAKGAPYIPVLSDSAVDESTPLPADEPPPFDGAIYTSGGGDNEIWSRCINRHNEAINVLFADWHASRVGLKGLWHLWWYPGWPKDLEANGGPPDFITITADYNGWMAHMKDYAGPP